MPSPFAPAVVLAVEENDQLQSLSRAHSSPQSLAFRCRLILRLAKDDRPSNLQVANEMNCSHRFFNLPFFDAAPNAVKSIR
jgi:hypothetical protein